MLKFLIIPMLLLSALSPAHAAGEFYCCNENATGKRLCADSLPPQCRGQVYTIIDNAGNVIKDVAPPLTAAEKAAQTLENTRRKRQEEAARELRRRDQALLDTYAMPEDIDLAQQKAEADINMAILATIGRIDTAHVKRKKLDEEAEFYKKTPMPADLAAQIKAINHEISLQQELLGNKQRDFETIRNKYDADRKRYYELTGRGSPTSRSTPRPR